MGEKFLFERQEGDKVQRLYGRDEGDLEIYVDGIHGMLVSQAHVKLNFYTVVPTMEGVEGDVERRQVACRVVMSIPAFFSMADYFEKHATEFKEKLTITPESLQQKIQEEIKSRSKKNDEQ